MDRYVTQDETGPASGESTIQTRWKGCNPGQQGIILKYIAQKQWNGCRLAGSVSSSVNMVFYILTIDHIILYNPYQ